MDALSLHSSLEFTRLVWCQTPFAGDDVDDGSGDGMDDYDRGATGDEDAEFDDEFEKEYLSLLQVCATERMICRVEQVQYWQDMCGCLHMLSVVALHIEMLPFSRCKGEVRLRRHGPGQ